MDTKEKVRQTQDAKGKRAATASHKRQNRHATPQRATQEPQRPLQDVVYMPPKPFVRNRLLLRLASVAAIVVALVLAMSVFFKVENIEVSGFQEYTAWDICEASGIEKGDSLFSLGLPGAVARILELPYVKDARIGIKLPNTVRIEVVEVRVTYAIKAQDESWWLVDSGGQIVEQVAQGSEPSHTKILGVHLASPEVGEQAAALETAQPETDEDGNTIPVTVTAAHQLSVALKIADLLETYGIIGKAASIDVNDLGNLQMWYGQQYQVKLGDENELERKIESVKGAIDSLSAESHNSGVLDATFTVDKTGVRYTRF